MSISKQSWSRVCVSLLPASGNTHLFKPSKEQHHLHSSGLGSVSFLSSKAHVEPFTSVVLPGTTFLDISPALHPSRSLPSDISDAQASNALFRLSFLCSVVCVSAGAAQGKYSRRTVSYVGGKAWWLKASFPGQISIICILSRRKLHL